MAKTKYTVIRRATTEDDGVGLHTDRLIQVAGEFEASTAEAACREAAAYVDLEGDYVAVPSRSFVAVPVKKEMAPRFIVSRRAAAA